MERFSKIFSRINGFYSLEAPAFLCIAGPSGCGKTQILHEIQSKVKKNDTTSSVLIIESHVVLEKILSKTYLDCAMELAEYNMVLIDQFEDIGKKQSTQQTFLSLITSLLRQNVSVAIALCLRASKATDNELHRLVLFHSFGEQQYHVIISPVQSQN